MPCVLRRIVIFPNIWLRRCFEVASPVYHVTEVLQQHVKILTTVSQSHYTTMLPHYGGSIGGHVRHSLDHFSKMLASDNNDASNTIEYDVRQRGSDVETNIDVALQAVNTLLQSTSMISKSNLSEVRYATFTSSAAGDTYTVSSTFGRELSFTAHHATHHLAYIRLMMKTHGYVIDDKIGVAPSTQHYHATN